MKRYRFKKIDAFASGRSSGNPAGYIALFPDDEITDGDMQQIARELKGFVSEVGFLRDGTPGVCDLSIRYFSCEREVEFCGHATIAIMDDLVRNDDRFRNRESLLLQTNKGVVKVLNRTTVDGMVYIRAPEPEFSSACPGAAETAAALGLELPEIDPGIPIGVVNAGLDTLLVPLVSLDACIRCSPDYTALRAFAFAHAVDVVVIYTHETEYAEHDLHSRVFAPTFGYLEDPATGSGNAALGNFLVRENLWTDRSLVIEQGPDREDPNIVRLLRPEDGGLMFGGRGQVRIDGSYVLSTGVLRGQPE
ncbi:PhzF family phenazine biosynthesis protein [Methanoculleus caldifontis]|uniref:PhzF family phenazine biosynthesis protein n=1 Tax=Methanoculleus caldifontis TaxID=2651577 RepID=UPI002936D5D4|nr:PhzF family phenazine biosynthesis protein [Methanoculleus sp. Wushi-C6]